MDLTGSGWDAAHSQLCQRVLVTVHNPAAWANGHDKVQQYWTGSVSVRQVVRHMTRSISIHPCLPPRLKPHHMDTELREKSLGRHVHHVEGPEPLSPCGPPHARGPQGLGGCRAAAVIFTTCHLGIQNTKYSVNPHLVTLPLHKVHGGLQDVAACGGDELGERLREKAAGAEAQTTVHAVGRQLEGLLPRVVLLPPQLHGIGNGDGFIWSWPRGGSRRARRPAESS